MFLVISGKAFAGKDTVADLLVDRLPGPVARMTVSDLIVSEADRGLDAMNAVPLGEFDEMAANST